jgi:hypothetical protein
MITCERSRESHTCLAATRLCVDVLSIEKTTERYQYPIRAFDRRMRRSDGAGAKTTDAESIRGQRSEVRQRIRMGPVSETQSNPMAG